MKTRAVTPAQIREAGFAALVRELGTAGALRCIRDFDPGSGDYTSDRAESLPDEDVRHLAHRIKRTRPTTSAMPNSAR